MAAPSALAWDSAELAAAITDGLKNTLDNTSLLIGRKVTGKVRDVYETDHHMVLVTTDRLSAFDRVLASVPFKGAVLNQVSAYWFDQTRHIIPNHVVAVPHPNVTVAKKCTPFKIEFVVRAYLTGSTSTSIWVHYNKGARTYCGHALSDGMRKNQLLPYVMCTPTTKDDDHDRPIDPEAIISEGWMTKDDWEYTSAKAIELFKFGQRRAAERKLILVDTKYEFGKDANGIINVIDEMHTPDSSRYWLAESYDKKFSEGKEPDNIDKEFLRMWFREHCDPYHDAKLPEAPADLVVELSRRYIQLYEKITGSRFGFEETLRSYAGSGISTALAARFPPAPCRLVFVFDKSKDVAVLKDIPSLLPHVAGASADMDTTRVAVEYVGSLYSSAMQVVHDVSPVAASSVPTVAVVVVADGALDHASRAVEAALKVPVITVLLGFADTRMVGPAAIASLQDTADTSIVCAPSIRAATSFACNVLSMHH